MLKDEKPEKRKRWYSKTDEGGFWGFLAGAVVLIVFPIVLKSC